MSLPIYTSSPYADDWSYGLAGAFANLSNVLLGSTVEIYTDLNRPADVVAADLQAQGVNITQAQLEPYTLPAAEAAPAASAPAQASEYPDQYAAASDLGRAVWDSASSGPVYDDEWLRGQLEQAGYGADPDPFAGNLPADILGSILGELPPAAISSDFPSELPPVVPVGTTSPPPPLPEDHPVMSIWNDIIGATSVGDLLGNLAGDLFGTGTSQPGTGYTIGGQFGNSVALPGTGPAAGTIAPRGYRWDAARGRWVKRRRMNPCNVHALRRALRRTEGFIRIEKRVDKIVNRAARAAGGARRHGFVRSKRK